MIPNEQPGPSYHGLSEPWHLYPVDVSLSSEGMAAVESSAADELLSNVEEPNVHVSTQCVRHPRLDELVHQYSLPYEQRDYSRIRMLGEDDTSD